MNEHWATVDQPAPSNGPEDEAAYQLFKAGGRFRLLVPVPLAEGNIARAAIGIERYGSALTANNGRDQIVDALQENCDLSLYTVCRILELESTQTNCRLGGMANNPSLMNRWSAAHIALGHCTRALRHQGDSAAHLLAAREAMRKVDSRIVS